MTNKYANRNNMMNVEGLRAFVDEFTSNGNPFQEDSENTRVKRKNSYIETQDSNGSNLSYKNQSPKNIKIELFNYEKNNSKTRIFRSAKANSVYSSENAGGIGLKGVVEEFRKELNRDNHHKVIDTFRKSIINANLGNSESRVLKE